MPEIFVLSFTPAERWGKTLFLNKRVSVPLFCEVVSLVMARNWPKKDALFLHEDNAALLHALAWREVLVMNEIAEGNSLKQIAERYHKSVSAISSHKRQAMKKLGISSYVKLLTLLNALYYADTDNAAWANKVTGA